MATHLNRWLQLSSLERGALVEAAVMLAAASLAVAVLPFRRAMALVRPTPSKDDELDTEGRAAELVQWAITACARRIPLRTLCLEQALASHWMLRRRSIASVVHYGTGKGERGLQAHAWVRTARHDVVGCDNAEDFVELARFPLINKAAQRR